MSVTWVRLDKPLGLVVIQAKCGRCGNEQTWTGTAPRRFPDFKHCGGQIAALPADKAGPVDSPAIDSVESDDHGGSGIFRQLLTGKTSFVREILKETFSAWNRP